MGRLTQTSDKGGVEFTFDLDITCRPSEAQKILRLAEKLKAYEDIIDEPEKLKLVDALYLERCEEINRLKAELAEKEEEFCEWKFEETTGIVWHCGNECTTYNLPYAKNLEIILKDFECKCPYCGRKIKEVKDGGN